MLSTDCADFRRFFLRSTAATPLPLWLRIPLRRHSRRRLRGFRAPCQKQSTSTQRRALSICIRRRRTVCRSLRSSQGNSSRIPLRSSIEITIARTHKQRWFRVRCGDRAPRHHQDPSCFLILPSALGGAAKSVVDRFLIRHKVLHCLDLFGGVPHPIQMFAQDSQRLSRAIRLCGITWKFPVRHIWVIHK
jgi:hypothetical protein